MQGLSAFRFSAGPTEPSRADREWQQVIRLYHSPVTLVLAIGEAGHAARARWDGGRWEENGVRERDIPSSGSPLHTRHFTPDCPYWNLEPAGPLHYRSTGRWERAEPVVLDAMWREAAYPPSNLLSYSGADFSLLLRYWLPPGILILKALYTFSAQGVWIITQSAWEWSRGM